MGWHSRWQDFWSEQTSPLHRSDSESHYRQYAAELRLLWRDDLPRSVLEIGCGNGALYPYLGFDQVDYTGVDYSQTMLDDFRRRYPDLHLECSDGAAYRNERVYELIFSNGVIQYFDQEMLQQHLQRARSMLAPGGRIVLASVPWRALKTEFYRGGAIVSRSRRRGRLAAHAWNWISRIRRTDMGRWYDLDELGKLAAELSLTPSFYGSLHYLYRFHAVLTMGSA